MVNLHRTLQHHFFQVRVSQGIAEIPPHAHEDDVGLKVTPLERMFAVHGRDRRANSSKYKYYLSQNTIYFCNTTVMPKSEGGRLEKYHYGNSLVAYPTSRTVLRGGGYGDSRLTRSSRRSDPPA
ncbi:MAG: hypothetical protein CLLPBCKN_006987 [Chroococcidiopsis cubana SAG 39.79]|nr:hypothetical protein [Chroococcidiopsis cubana SAG 39.79]